MRHRSLAGRCSGAVETVVCAPAGVAGVVGVMTRQSRIPAFIVALAGGLTLGCGSNSPGPVICTAEARAAVSLVIVDSLTNKGDALTGLWARAVDGTYRDSSVMTFSDQSLQATRMALAYERKGTYTVTVHATGYQDWTKTGVLVTADQCHVNGVSLTAKLVR
jgi:hypothetical protein